MNSIGAQFYVGHPYMEPYFYEVSPNGPSPTFAQLSPSQPEKQPPMGTIGKNEGHENLTLSTNPKRFLVFDQSGDQTTLLISSGFGAPVPPLNSWLKGDGPVAKGVSDPLLEDEHQNDGVENDMHEDTEELNALLYSDDDYSEDDEETSTGHSPNEEVASSGPTKRTKLLDGGYGTPSVIMKAEFLDTASSLKRASHPSPDEFRKENIHDTIRILREIIPDGQGKDSIDIIDEAIDYLKSLKAKAKDWGLDGR